MYSNCVGEMKPGRFDDVGTSTGLEGYTLPTLCIQTGLSCLVLRDLVHLVLPACLIGTEGLLGLWYVHLQQSHRLVYVFAKYVHAPVVTRPQMIR